MTATPLLTIFCLLIGLVVGSFLNVVIYRGPAWWGLTDDTDRGTLLGPRSKCPRCRTTIRSWDNIPLISYLLLRGRCRDCGFKIPVLYPIVEGLGGAAALLSLAMFGPTIAGLWFALFCWTLIALAVIDAQTGYLPDMLTLPLIIAGFLTNGLAANGGGNFVPLTDAIIGAIAGGGVFWAIAAGYRALRGHDGLGLGDAKLLAALGAWLGWMALAPIVLIASLAAIILILMSRALAGDAENSDDITGQTLIRFGPALAIAGVAVAAINRIYPLYGPFV